MERTLVAEVKGLHESARQDMAGGKWRDAWFNLQQIQSRFPNYEDTFQMMNRAKTEGSRTYFEQAGKAFEDENFKDTVELSKKALSLD